MIQFPIHLVTRYQAYCRGCGIMDADRADYLKWLRFFMDFCEKYQVAGEPDERIHKFLDKLKQKNQGDEQRRRAHHAVVLYFKMLKNSHASQQTAGVASSPVEQHTVANLYETKPPAFDTVRKSFYSEAGYQETSSSPEWDAVMAAMAAEIKVRHYSRKTLKTYALWSRKFQHFLKNKLPAELGSEDVKTYLTHLAVDCHVAASTQNQAFNSLLFFYRHGLKAEFGILQGVPRAKKSLYVPVVLSRAEIDAILAHLDYPFNLVVKVLFGCGLRLFECLQLRVRDFNFDAGVLTIHRKGKKDRTVPLPESILTELKAQIDFVMNLHEKDLEAGYAGVFLDDAVERKFPKAPKELLHQWFFPQQTLTLVEEAGELRRYHLHESLLQRTLYTAVRKAKIPKRVTAHTFRHSYATHLLQANYDIRTIQTKLGHSSLKTTMIYTHCVPVRTMKEARSPLDLDTAGY